MKIKGIVAVDLDGTLLDAKGNYSDATRDYLRLLPPAGYVLVLASGRPVRAMERIYEDLRCTGPIIAYNGALVFNPKDPDFPVFQKAFPAETIRAICSQSKGYVTSFMAESLRAIYIDEEDPHLDHYFPYEGMPLVKGPLSETIHEDLFTCIFRCPQKLHPQLQSACEQYEGIAWRSWSNSDYSELFVPSADKGSALAYIAKMLDVDKRDIYAFGDAENDITMLDAAGHPYVMDHSRAIHLMTRFPKTKYPVEEDGVIRTLQSILTL